MGRQHVLNDSSLVFFLIIVAQARPKSHFYYCRSINIKLDVRNYKANIVSIVDRNVIFEFLKHLHHETNLFFVGEVVELENRS